MSYDHKYVPGIDSRGGRTEAPEDYIFKNIVEIGYTKALGEDPRNEYLKAIEIYDDNYFRAIYTSSNGFYVPGLDALNEASKRDREKPTEERREPYVISAILAGINEKFFFGEQRNLDSFLSDAARYLNGELPFDWPTTAIGEFIDAGRKPRRREPDLMNRLAQVDKTSRDDSARWLGIRKPFHFEKMRWVDEIFEDEIKAKNGRPLTHEERMKALARAGEYIYQNPETGEIIFVSDKGDFSISVTPNILQTVDRNKQREYLEERIKKPELWDTDEIIKKMKDELEAIDLYAGAYKTMNILISYYTSQGRTDYFKETHLLIIPKEDVKHWTGEDGKNGYRTFKRWLYALYYSTVNIKSTIKHGKPGFDSDGTARFIFQISEEQKYYLVGFNANLYPATLEIVQAGKHADQSILSDRRYYYLAPRLLSEQLTPQAFYYADWITSETGNNQVKDIPDGQKVIVFSGEFHCTKANIQQDRREKKPKQMISIWRELIKKEIIIKTEPSTKTLEKLRPKDFLKTIIRVYALKDNRELNELLRQKSQAEK